MDSPDPKTGPAVGMTIKERSVDALTTVVELEGELDLYAAAELNASLTHAVDEQCRRLVVDVRGVTRIDFSLIAIIVQTGRVLGQRHGTMEVVCADDEIGRMLARAGERGRFEVTVAPDGDGDRPED